MGFPSGASGKEPACQCRRHKRRGFDPWVGKILWSRAWQPRVIGWVFYLIRGQGTGWFTSGVSWQQLLCGSVRSRDFCPVMLVQGSAKNELSN